MQWQRLLRSAAAVVGAAALGCESVPALRAADPGLPPAATRPQKPEGTVTTVASVRAPDSLPEGRLVTSVRAFVNGRPIFDDEISEAALGQLATLNPAADGYQAEVKKIKAAALDQLIDRELLIQEAENKLKMAGKKDVLDKVKEEADGQFQRWVKQARAAFKSDDEFKAYLRARGTSYEGQRRLRQRIFLADEYLRSNVMRFVDHRTSHQELLDYYKAHPEEFQRTDSAKWQDIFLDAAQYPDREAAYRTATEVAAQARSGGEDDFVKLCEKYDNGLAKTKKGAAGIGTHREDVSPPEAAPVLFQMQDGEVGPIVAVPAGFHVLRLVKRTHAGLAPFNEEVQRAIKDKLRNEVYALEAKRFLEELRQNAHVEKLP